MGKYNVFARGTALRGWIAAAVAGLSACAATPPPSAPPVPAESPQAATSSGFEAPEPATGEPELRADAPLSYTVQKGDTLWSIAQKFLLNPFEWPEIWYVNDRIANPHHIYPGDVLRLVDVGGRRRVTVTDRLSPQIRETPLPAPIPVIQLDAIRDFLNGPRMLTEEELDRSGYVLSFVDNRLLGGSGNQLYARHLPDNNGARAYAVLRRTQAYHDPDNGDVLGYEAIPTGQVALVQGGDPATAVITASYREVLAGDRILPVEPDPFTGDVYPTLPDGAVEGRIMAVFDGVSEIGQYQIVAINRGTQHGLQAGNVLDILQAGDEVVDNFGDKTERVQLPDQRAGQLLVFKCTPRLSYGLVMILTRPVHALDKVATPQPWG